MSNVTSTFRGASSGSALTGATTPLIYNVSVPTADTEVSQLLSSNTKQFTIKVRGNSTLRLAFASGESDTNYITVTSGASYTADALNFSGTLYFQTNKASQIVEILEWS